MDNQQLNGGVPPPRASTSAVGSKRLRRPSVRLGEIGGDHHHDSKGQRKPPNSKKDLSKSSKTNLGSGYENSEEGNVGIGSWRVKKRVGSTKRVRSNWVSKTGDGEGGFRDFSREDSESSPIKEESCRRSSGNELSEEPSSNMDGVKIWLQELGLGRYWPMFEIHEVDQQVLPLLTLEDLKDMGITAVGSRRKMFSAIQKLGGRDLFS